MSSDTKASRPISRRAVVGAAVWATPVVAVVTATPAHATGSLPKGSIEIQTISVWGNAGERVKGTFGVQANKGVAGDKRTVVLRPEATLQMQSSDGGWEDVGTIPLTPSSHSGNLDGGHQQFSFEPNAPTITAGHKYRVVVIAFGTQSDGEVLTASGVSSILST